MQFTHADNQYILRLDRGEEVVSTLTDFLTTENITAASVSGIGAVKDVTLYYYSVAEKEYQEKHFNEEYEVLSLLGNVSIKEGEPFAHLHVTLGASDFSVTGGHLAKATVAVTLELVVGTINCSLKRELDQGTGLSLLAQ